MVTQNLFVSPLLDAVASPLLICQDNTIVFANPSAEKLLGYTRLQLIDRTVDSLIYMTSSKSFTAWYTQRLISAGSESLDVRFIAADLSLIWIKITALATVFEEKNLQILTMQDITQSRKTEIDLYLSDAYRDMLTTNNPDVVMMTDQFSNLLYVSPSIQETLGYAREDVLGQKWIEKVHPDDQIVTTQAAQEVRKTNKSVHIEARVRNHLGEYIWFEGLVGIVSQQHDDQIRLISSVRNIHKHKLTEIALREREQHLRLIADSMQDIVLEITPDGLIRYLSPSCFAIMGYRMEEMVGRSHLENVHPEDVPIVLEYFSQALIQPTRTPLELRFRHKDGHFLWMEIIYKIVTDDKGEMQSIVISAREVTKRKEAQLALLQSQHLFQQIMDIAPMGIYIYDVQQGRDIYHNQRLSKQPNQPELQVENADPASEFYAKYVHPDDAERHHQHSERLLQAKDGEVIESENRVRRADGTYSWFYFRDTVFKRDENGKPLQFLGTMQDITGRKLADEKLRTNQHLLEEITTTIPLDIYIYDVNQQHNVFFNRTENMGYPVEHIDEDNSGGFYTKLVHPDDLEKHRQNAQRLRLARDGELLESEYRMKHASGEWRWYYFRDIVFARNPDGTPSQFLGSIQDITARKQTEAELLRSQQMLQQVTSTVPVDIYIYDVDLNRGIFTNRPPNLGYDNLLNADSSEAFFRNLVHPDDLMLYDDFHQRLASSPDGSFVEGEFRMRRADGQWMWRNYRNTVLHRHADGTPSQYLGTVEDITLRKQTEASLRQSRHMFQQVAETVPMQIFIYDLDSKRNSFENHPSDLGYPDEVLLTNSEAFHNLLIHPDDRDGNDEIMHKLYNAPDGEIFENEFRIRAADGQYRWRYYRYTPFARNADGSLRQFLGTFQDIDERKIAEKSLRENEEKLRLITDNIHDLVALTDESMHYRYVTPSHLRILGYQPEELIGKSVFELVHPDDIELVETKTMAAIEKRQADSSEFRVRHHDGYYLWMETNGSLAIGTKGEFSGAIFASRDVSERRWMQRAMMEQEKLLVMLQKEQELSSLKTRMMSRLSHELRTPLAVISTSADLLDLYGKRMTEEQRVERLQQIKTQVKHFTGMLDNMALVVKGISYSMDFAPSPYNLDLTAKTVIKELKDLLHVQHEVKLQLEGDVSAVNSDEQLMRLILTHLLANALKYSPPTKPIIISAVLLPETITVTVQDQGMGILPEERERIFEPFFRGTNINEVPGLGVGLSIVKDAVDSMEGKIEVESQIGVGTTVTVHIPLGGVIGIN